jgi:hypothetical protein
LLADDSSATPGLSCAGDFNDDGTCDAADYPVWRKHVGLSVSLPDEVEPFGVVSAADYLSWRANFGLTLAGAGGSLPSSARATPEPGSLTLASVAAVATITISRRARRPHDTPSVF